MLFNNSVRAGNGVVPGAIVPIQAFFNQSPFCLRTSEINGDKRYAIVEYTVSDDRDAVWNDNACQTGAIIECKGSDARDAAWDGDARQTGAIVECLGINYIIFTMTTLRQGQFGFIARISK